MSKRTLPLLLIILGAFILRTCRLDFFALRGDEAFTVVFVQRTWEGLWKGISLIEPNPPLLYLALRIWVAVAGASEYATRYFSLFFGVLCVPLLYRLAKEMLRTLPRGQVTRIATVAAFLIAINPYQIWHSQDVRNYTMWPALSLAALIFLWRWVESWKAESAKWKWEAKNWNLVWYGLATTASLYTHYYDTFILVAENLFVFGAAAIARRWGALTRWIAVQALIALVYLPWVLFGTNRITTYGEGSASTTVSPVEVFSRTMAAFIMSETVPETLWTALWLPLAVVLSIVLIYLARRERPASIFLLLYLAIPTLALYVVSIGRPLFLERYLNGIAPGYYLLFAIPIAVLWTHARTKIKGQSAPSLQITWRNGLAATAVMFFIGTSAFSLWNYQFEPAYAKAPDWRSLAHFIADRHQPGDIIVQNYNEMALVYYLKGTPVITVPKDFWPQPADERVMEQLNRDQTRIWFLPALPDAWDPRQVVENYLARHDELLIDRTFGTLRLQLYATPRQYTPQIIPVNVRVGTAELAGYRIHGMDQAGASLPSPSSSQVTLYWRALDKTTQDLTVFLHLKDGEGRVVAQADGMPVKGTWGTPQWVPGELVVDTHRLTVDVPTGEYTLVAGMYDATTLARAAVSSTTGVTLPDNQVLLTRVTVAR